MMGPAEEFLAELHGAILLVAVIGVVGVIAWMIWVNGASRFSLVRIVLAPPPGHPLVRRLPGERGPHSC